MLTPERFVPRRCAVRVHSISRYRLWSQSRVKRFTRTGPQGTGWTLLKPFASRPGNSETFASSSVKSPLNSIALLETHTDFSWAGNRVQENIRGSSASYLVRKS